MLLLKLKISGHSMQPLIKDKETIIVSSIPYMFKKPKVDDIVAVNYKNKIFIKRIKFIEGEKYYVLGDNRKDSIDSRSFGFILRRQILGKFIFKF